MPIHHAVLALLAKSPSHGYALKNSFEQTVGDQWGGLNIGHLYQVLDRLKHDGLVEAERQPQAVKPDRLVYTITAAGKAELTRWLGEPTRRSRGYRDDFFLKLMAVAQTGDSGTLASLLATQRHDLLVELRSLAEARTIAPPSPIIALLITAAEQHTRADLTVVGTAEELLDPATLAQFALPRSADNDTTTEAGPANGSISA